MDIRGVEQNLIDQFKFDQAMNLTEMEFAARLGDKQDPSLLEADYKPHGDCFWEINTDKSSAYALTSDLPRFIERHGGVGPVLGVSQEKKSKIPNNSFELLFINLAGQALANEPLAQVS